MRLGVNVRDGAIITAVNNQPVTRERSPVQLMVYQAGTEVVLRVLDAPSGVPREVIIKAAGDDTPIRYREWVERNRAWVHEKSRGRCGYVHVPDMGPGDSPSFIASFSLNWIGMAY